VDPLGLLAVTAAVIAFPGGAYALAAAWTVAHGLRDAPAERQARGWWRVDAVAAGTCALAVCVLTPLPGSPAVNVPDQQGAQANLLAAVLLLGVAIAIGSRARWHPARLLAAAAALVPSLVLGAAAATFDFAAIAGMPSRTEGAARICAAVALLVAAPGLALPRESDSPPLVPAVLIGAAAILAAGLSLPSPTAPLPAAATAVIVLAAIAAYAFLVGLTGRRALTAAAAMVAGALASVAVVLAIVAQR
jgi:hypothetical protein